MRVPGVIDALDALERYARAFDEIMPQVQTLLIDAIERRMPWTWEPSDPHHPVSGR